MPSAPSVGGNQIRASMVDRCDRGTSTFDDNRISRRALFLRHVRVNSLGELKVRIRQGIDEMNAAPVVFRSKVFDPVKT